MALVVRNPPANAEDIREAGSILRSGIVSGGGMPTHSSILSGEYHGKRSLVGYSPFGSERI